MSSQDHRLVTGACVFLQGRPVETGPRPGQVRVPLPAGVRHDDRDHPLRVAGGLQQEHTLVPTELGRCPEPGGFRGHCQTFPFPALHLVSQRRQWLQRNWLTVDRCCCP